MSQDKLMNRWLIVPAAIVIQLCLGVMYAWSVFAKPLKAEPYNFSNTQTQIILSAALVVFAIVMIFAGRMLGKISPRVLCATGGVLLGLGYIAGSIVAGRAESLNEVVHYQWLGGRINFDASPLFWYLLLTLGVISGAGIGLSYVVPISVGVKWFPDKKGMLTGLSVAGFGFGALIWLHVAGQFGGLIESHGIPFVLMAYGIVLAVATVLGSLLMVNPPDGYKPAGWEPTISKSSVRSASGATDLSAGEMLGSLQFYILWFIFAVGSLAGLMVIGNIHLFGTDALMSKGIVEDNAKRACDIAMGVCYALANGMGRIGWGMISDKLGRVSSIAISFFIQGLVMLAFYQMGFNVALLCLGAAIIGFNYGGCFALFPAATADFFGSKNVGANYAWVFTAYGVGGIVGPIMAGYFGDQAEKLDDLLQWRTPFVVAGIACLLCAALTWLLRSKPARVEAVENTAPIASHMGDSK